MADFAETFKLLWGLEFSNPYDFLHKNRGEKSYTIGGVYPYSKLECKSRIDRHLRATNYNVRLASKRCYRDDVIFVCIYTYYEREYFVKYRLDELRQDIADEIFIFAINTGRFKTAINFALEIAGLPKVGRLTDENIPLLNQVDNFKLNKRYDEKEVRWYARLVRAKSKFLRYLNGWINRAFKV